MQNRIVRAPLYTYHTVTLPDIPESAWSEVSHLECITDKLATDVMFYNAETRL